MVQVWVKDEEQARLILATKALESGSKLPYHGLRWECERVVLEIHKKSVNIASRERMVFGFLVNCW